MLCIIWIIKCSKIITTFKAQYLYKLHKICLHFQRPALHTFCIQYFNEKECLRSTKLKYFRMLNKTQRWASLESAAVTEQQ